MKKVLQQFCRKITALVILVCAFAYKGTSQITMSTANCVATANEVQMDIMVTNNSAADLRWNLTVLRFTVPAAMIPSTGTNTYSFNYVGGSDFPLSFPNNPPAVAFGGGYTVASRLLTWTTGNSSAYNNLNCPGDGVTTFPAPLIASGVTKKIGRFSFKNTSQNFVAGADATFTWNTTSGCTLYQACAGATTNYNQASGLRTLSAPCPLSIPNSCNVSGSAVVTNPACFGGTGSAVVTLTGTGAGAPGTYTVDGGPATAYAANPFTVTGLANGNHTIVATVTAGGCVSSNIAANVVEPAALTGSASGTTAVSCFGSTDGTTSITLSTSTSGTYSVDGGPSLPYSSNPFTVSGLAAGNHSIVATSAAGCASNAIPVTVGNVAALTGSAAGTDATCFGGTGSAQVTLSASTSGTYSLDGGPATPYSTNPFTISGLSVASHTITATSTAGCVSNTMNVTINSPAALTGSGTTTPVSCFGSTDGTATITLSASTSGTYTVDGGPSVAYNSNPFTVNGLAAGNHTIVATSAAGCVSSLIGVNVGSVAALTGSGTTTPTTCGNGANGTATITLSSSTSGTYTLDGGPSVAYNSNPFTITGLSAGNHTIVATSASGCVSSNIPVTVGGSATFVATAAHTNLSHCSGVPDGTITITPVGGTAPYTYSWTGETGSNHTPFTAGNTATLTNLNYGYYTVTITDAGGCGIVTVSNIHVEIGYTVAITYSGSAANSCGGSTGSIILYGNSGLPPYTWSMTSNAGPFQASNTFTGLAAGTYTVWVKDNGGCTNSRSVTVGSAPAIVVSPSATASSSCGADGSVQIFRSGGIPPYTYSITSNAGPFVSGNTFTGLAAGPYTAYVKDAAGCVGQQAFTVAAGAALTVTANKVNTSTCVNDGSIQVNASGGTAPYTYSKDGGTTFQSGNTFSALGQGNYPIVVKDFKGCTGNLNVTINLNTIVVTASVVNATTCVSNNGKITLFRTGGYGPYSYSLDGNTYQASSVFTNVAAGTYTGYVKDAQTCIGSLPGIVVGPTGCAPGLTVTSPNTNNVKVNSQVVSADLKVQAYPNPSQSEFTLVLQGYDSKAKVSITVTDLLGRKVYQTEGIGKQQYKFGTGFIAGVYNVQVVQGTEKKSLKLVKE